MSSKNSNLMESFLKQVSSKITTDNTLGIIKELNTKARNVEASFLPESFEDFLAGDFTDNQYLLDIIARLKSIRNAKFEYSNLPFDKWYLENMLYYWGRIAVFKFAGEIVCGSFVVEQTDIYGKAKVIRPILQSGKILKRRYIGHRMDGKKAVVIYNDDAWILAKRWYGPLWRQWQLIKDLTDIKIQIMKNVKTSRGLILGDQMMSEDERANLEALIESGKIVIPLNRDNNDIQLGRNKGLFADQIQDRTENLWENYVKTYTELKIVNGLEGNLNNEKAERQTTTEVSMEFDMANAINEDELKHRKKGFDEVNKVFGTNIKVSLVFKPKDDTINSKEKNNGNQKSN